MKLAIVFSCALAWFAAPVFAQPVAVTASITGSNTFGWTYTGVATGTLDGDILVLDQGSLRIEDPGPPADITEYGFDNNFDFSGPSGVYSFTSCTPISGSCAGFIPSTGSYDSVAGTPQLFTTIAGPATLNWVVTEIATVPALPGFGLAMLMLGLLLVAVRSLFKRNVKER